MRRLNNSEVVLSDEELQDIQAFLRECLIDKWDQFTSVIITTDTLEEGMRRMSPVIYAWLQESYKI